MNFSFSGRHMEIGDSLTKRAQEACNALARKYNVNFIDVNIVMKKETYLYRCDVAIKSQIGNSYYASDEADDPVTSFLLTLQKIDLQIRKKKKSSRTTSKDQKVEIISYDNSLMEENPVIIAEMLDDLPLLSVSEATKRLNDNKRVFIFENISNNAVNVVYKRDDGNFGWIDYKIKR